MKVIKALSVVMYHCFKLLQIGVYALVASELLDWWNFVVLGFVVFALLLPTVAIYVASFRSGKSILAWKAAHGYSVLLGYLSFAISVMICFDVNFVGAFYVFIFGLGTIPVMVEGLVAYVLWKRSSPPVIVHMPQAG